MTCLFGSVNSDLRWLDYIFLQVEKPADIPRMIGCPTTLTNSIGTEKRMIPIGLMSWIPWSLLCSNGLVESSEELNHLWLTGNGLEGPFPPEIYLLKPPSDLSTSPGTLHSIGLFLPISETSGGWKSSIW